MATHKSCSESIDDGSDVIPESTDYTCDEHQGRIYEMYCKEHDQIFCALCILKHRKCEGVEHFPNIAEKLLQQQNEDEIKSGLMNLSSDLQYIKERLSVYLIEMNNEESNVLDNINQFKKRMLKRIQEEAKSSIAKVKSRYKAIIDDIERDYKKVDQMHEDIKKYISRLCMDSYVDDAEHFATIKLAESKTTTGDEFASALIWKPMEMNVFECNSIFEKSLNESSLGQITVIERPLGEVVNILDGRDINMKISTINSVQSGLHSIGIRSKVIKEEGFNAFVPTVGVVSSPLDLYCMLNALEKLYKQQECKILMLCLTSVRVKDPEPSVLGKTFDTDKPFKVSKKSRGYADIKCEREKIPYVYIETEKANPNERDIADAVQFIYRSINALD